jgi:hypothetical protein
MITVVTTKNMSKRAYTSVDRRKAKPPRMVLGELDRKIILSVYRYRLLSQGQVEQLLNRSTNQVRRLLRRLYDHHYLERVFLPVARIGTPPAFYILDKKGRELLRELAISDPTFPRDREGEVDFSGQPKTSITGHYINHANDINRVRIAIETAADRQGIKVVTWRTEDELKAAYDRVSVPSSKEPVSLIPDSFLVLEKPGQNPKPLFLELDRGQMRLNRFKSKIEAYTVYYKTKAFSSRYGYEGFRVLTVVADNVGIGRVQQLIQLTEGIPKIGHRFWFAHLSAILQSDPLAVPVWTVAAAETKTQALFS